MEYLCLTSSGQSALYLPPKPKTTNFIGPVVAEVSRDAGDTTVFGIGYGLAGKVKGVGFVTLFDLDTQQNIPGYFLGVATSATWAFVKDQSSGHIGASLVASYASLPESAVVGFLNVTIV